MARGRRPSGFDVQVDQRRDLACFSSAGLRSEACISSRPPQQMTDSVVDVAGLSAGAMQAEGDGAIPSGARP